MANTFLTKTKANLTGSLATVYTADTSNQTACVIIGMTFTIKLVAQGLSGVSW